MRRSAGETCTALGAGRPRRNRCGSGHGHRARNSRCLDPGSDLAILRTTENAGTARFTVTELTTSTSPGLASDFVESGEINFRTGDIDVTTRDSPSNAGAGTGPGSDLSEMRILVTRNSLIIFEKIPAVGLLGTSWAKDKVTSSSWEQAEIEGSFGPFAALQVSSSAHITCVKRSITRVSVANKPRSTSNVRRLVNRRQRVARSTSRQEQRTSGSTVLVDMFKGSRP